MLWHNEIIWQRTSLDQHALLSPKIGHGKILLLTTFDTSPKYLYGLVFVVYFSIVLFF